MSSRSETSYVPLWCTSNYSFLEGASDPEELVERAAELNLPAVGLTDRDGLYGVVRAHSVARHIATKLLIGSQVTLEEGGIVLLYATTREGYGNLCELISRGRLQHPKGTSAVSVEDISAFSAGILCIVVPLPEYPCSTVCARLSKIFVGSVFLGIARHSLPLDLSIERRGRMLAAECAIPCVATPRILYHTPERRPLQDVLSCIRFGCTLESAGELLNANAECALRSAESLLRRYRDDPELVSNTHKIADRINFSLDQLHYRYPHERLPDGVREDQRLGELTLSGAHVRYPHGIPDDVSRQLRRELSIIGELEYGGYFLTMYEIVCFCRRKEIMCQGRGSAANSAVCYCLGITAVDPVRMQLLFERFLSRERAEPPDIDLDIEHSRREEVIEFMYERYGREHAAMVANVVRFRLRSAVREVGKVFEYTQTTLDRVARIVSQRDVALADALVSAGLDPEGDTVRKFISCCRSIVGTPRHLSIHPGGFLLGNEPVTRLVPVEQATMPGRTVIQWDKYDIEELNLFKVDLLGLGALSHLDICFRLLRKHYGIDLDMSKLPPGDPAVFRMISRGDTVGVFQLESRAQMAMLPRMQPRCFYDIVIEISIVRPGPISGGMVHPYLRRRHGEEPVIYPHPTLKPVLEKTLGIPLFQEQVMKLAVIAADYSAGEADQLRRDMAAWRKTGRIEKHRTTLIERMTAKGIEERFAEQVFDQIRGFGEYGFPESHAASFALIAYATAWMRHHYPAVFTCGLLNAWPMGFYTPATIIEDARRQGISILPVCIDKSDWFCTLVARTDRSRTDAYAVRMGLRFVQKLGDSDYKNIVRQRPFSSIDDLMSRTEIDEGVLTSLAESGALHHLGVDRREALWAVYGKNGKQTRADAVFQRELAENSVRERPVFDRVHRAEQVIWDYESSGHSVRGHPLEALRPGLSRVGLPDAAALAARPDGVVARYAGLVICRQRPETAGGTLFMTLEDESGFVNLIITARVLNEFRALILTRHFIGVTGTLQRHPTSVYVLADAVWDPEKISQIYENSSAENQTDVLGRVASRDFR